MLKEKRVHAIGVVSLLVSFLFFFLWGIVKSSRRESYTHGYLLLIIISYVCRGAWQLVGCIPVDLFRLLTYVFQIKCVGRVHSNHKLDDDRVSWLLPPSFFFL